MHRKVSAPGNAEEKDEAEDGGGGWTDTHSLVLQEENILSY
jgi:hypothetical protein